MSAHLYIIFCLVALSHAYYYSCERPDSFHCDIDNCIRKTWVCDGEDDCPNGGDEEICQHQLKSGDRIALRAQCNYFEYLSNYYTYASIHSCPLVSMNGNDWHECSSETWTILAYNRNVGEPIRWGDKIVLQGKKKDYLKCRDNHTEMEECIMTTGCSSDFADPKSTAWTTEDLSCKESIFNILQRGREATECDKGAIGVNSEIFILHSASKDSLYLSVDINRKEESWVGLKGCPGSNYEQLDLDKCGCERWFVFRE